MRFCRLVLAMLLVASRCWAADPVDLMKRFYGEADALGVSGFSDEKQMARVRPLLSDDLNALFTEAQKAVALRWERGQQELAKREAGGKNPIARKFVLGRLPPFTNSGEGREYLGLGESSVSGSRAYVQVKMKLPGDDLTWTDLLVLHRTEAGWKIDDILFESGDKEVFVRTLLHHLASSIEQANAPSGE